MVVWACLCVGGASENFLLKTRYINSLFDWLIDALNKVIVSDMTSSRRESKVMFALPQVVVLWTSRLWRQEVVHDYGRWWWLQTFSHRRRGTSLQTLGGLLMQNDYGHFGEWTLQVAGGRMQQQSIWSHRSDLHCISYKQNKWLTANFQTLLVLNNKWLLFVLQCSQLHLSVLTQQHSIFMRCQGM